MTFAELMQTQGFSTPEDLALRSGLDHGWIQWLWHPYGPADEDRFYRSGDYAAKIMQGLARFTGLSLEALVWSYHVGRWQGHVYIAQVDGLTKLGYTRNLHIRRRVFLTHLLHLTFLHTIVTNDSRRLERQLHARFAAYRVEREWYALPAPELAALCAVKSYHFKPPTAQQGVEDAGDA